MGIVNLLMIFGLYYYQQNGAEILKKLFANKTKLEFVNPKMAKESSHY